MVMARKCPAVVLWVLGETQCMATVVLLVDIIVAMVLTGGVDGGYNGYGASTYGIDGWQGFQQSHSRPGMQQYPRTFHAVTPSTSMPDVELFTHGNFKNIVGHFSPFGRNQGLREGYEQTLGFDMQDYPRPRHTGGRTRIKRESPTMDERFGTTQNIYCSTKELVPQSPDNVDENGEDIDAIEADLAVAELELKLARARAAKARSKAATRQDQT